MDETFETFINLHYTKLLSMCKRLAPDDPGGLLHETLLYLLGRDITGVRNMFSYVYVALKTQAYSPNSRFNRHVRPKVKDRELTVNDVKQEDKTVDEDVEKFNMIMNTLENMEIEGTINWYEKKIFKLYYAYETQGLIHGLTLGETNEKRKMSFRKLETELNINMKSIWRTTNHVLEKLKAELEKNRENGRDEKPLHGQSLQEKRCFRQAHGEA